MSCSSASNMARRATASSLRCCQGGSPSSRASFHAVTQRRGITTFSSRQQTTSSSSLLDQLRRQPRPLSPFASLASPARRWVTIAPSVAPPAPSLPPPLPLRCTILDARGSVQVISGSFPRSELCQEHKLEGRDLRKVDSRIPNVVPTILVRQEAFLVNMLHARALVKRDKVLLFDTYGSTDTALHSAFIYALQHNLSLVAPHTTLPYEFRALESILSSVLSALSSELSLLRSLVGTLLDDLEDDIDREKLLDLLLYIRKLRAFLARCKGTGKCVRDLLEEDEDLEAMYLTLKRKGTGQHQELELLLESFVQQVEELVAEGESMSSNINGTREIIDLILDSNRNQLLALDLRTSMTTLGVSAGTLLAGLFGMNLVSGYEQSPYVFYGASAAAFGAALIVTAIGLRTLNRTRRVGLMMRGGRAGAHAQISGSSSSGSDRAPGWWGRNKKRRDDRRRENEVLRQAAYTWVGGPAAQTQPEAGAGAANATQGWKQQWQPSAPPSQHVHAQPDVLVQDAHSNLGNDAFSQAQAMQPLAAAAAGHPRHGPLYDASKPNARRTHTGTAEEEEDASADPNAAEKEEEKPWRPFKGAD